MVFAVAYFALVDGAGELNWVFVSLFAGNVSLCCVTEHDGLEQSQRRADGKCCRESGGERGAGDQIRGVDWLQVLFSFLSFPFLQTPRHFEIVNSSE